MWYPIVGRWEKKVPCHEVRGTRIFRDKIGDEKSGRNTYDSQKKKAQGPHLQPLGSITNNFRPHFFRFHHWHLRKKHILLLVRRQTWKASWRAKHNQLYTKRL